MKGRTAGFWCASFMLGLLLAGCNQDQQAQGAAGNHRIHAYQDGAQRVLSQGKGLNVRMLSEIRRSFARQQMRLTDEGFAEDGRGNVSYQYLIESEPSQSITIHAFSSRYELLNRMPHWYGKEQVVETSTARTEIYNGRKAAIVYTSLGKDKGKYSGKIKAMSTQLLNRLNLPQDRVTSETTKIVD